MRASLSTLDYQTYQLIVIKKKKKIRVRIDEYQNKHTLN